MYMYCYCLKSPANPRKELLSSVTRGEEAFISTARVSGSLAIKDTILYLSLRETWVDRSMQEEE